ncbi:B12-binding domain-containing radical SAM protein [Clostridium cylindrosporum]|uniref:Radical SAM domain-containing protein n=1 Tax=Clostridium cylindrosporum DSM 605 TaxID=1121307 RepID=A0A0J8DBX8_CLOCY|nr:radical SAM protein [Clostridium cylindrosporum]KMT21788.1 radical SAM domain-containing protein [Clostridium cylindrosporum DSM 605]
MSELKKLNKRWAAQVTIGDCNNDELLKAASSAGCKYLFVGLESFSDNTLKGVNKALNKTGDYKSIIEKIHRNKILVQAGIVFGFDTDTKDIFDKTLDACEEIGIDGVTVSILTPFPKTPIYNQLREEGRLLTENWTYYNSKTSVVFQPRNMTADELFDGYMRFRRKFYSLRSFIKRMRVSRTNVIYNFIINLGYWMAI